MDTEQLIEFWNAAQRRNRREERARMVEAWMTATDAYVHGSVRTGKVKPKTGKFKAPWYAQDPDKPKEKGKSGQDLWDAVDAMNKRLN